jgi:cytoskeletal protein CcmA (bactofilin family)
MFFKTTPKQYSSVKEQLKVIQYGTVISDGVTVDKLTASGDSSIRVAGTVSNGITKDDVGMISLIVVIAESGTVTGTISAARVFVDGTVHGDIFADDVYLSSTANVIGDIHYTENLQVDTGASLSGNVIRCATNKAGWTM